MNLKIKFNHLQKAAIFISIIVLIISCFRYIVYGSVNTDEPIQLLGVEEHLKFALSNLKKEGKSFKEITENMEYYGVALKIIYALPWLIIKSIFNSENKLLLFISLRGFALLIYLASGIIFFFTSNFYQKRKSNTLLLIYFTFPLLAGESYLNITDIPFAICFSFYSLLNGILVISFEKNLKTNNFNLFNKKVFWASKNNLYFLSVLMPAFLINSKASIIAVVFIIELMLAYYLFERKVIFFENFLNFCTKLKNRFIHILALTYIISPASWLNPIKYFKESIFAFSNFYGIFGARIAGYDLATNTDSWSLFEYLSRWLQIKIPIIMMLLIFIFIIIFIYRVIFKNASYRNEKFLNPILIFYGLQLIVTPSLAIAANSSSYNALRHWCFIYPPLIIFSAFIIDNYLINAKNKIFNLISKFCFMAFAFLGITDNVLMMPYSNLSFNLFGRQFVKQENTDIDYWGYSAGELLKKKFIKNYKVRSDTGSFTIPGDHIPHHINNSEHKYPYALASNTRGNFKIIDNQCKQVENVSRNLLFRKNSLIISKIGLCPLFDGKDWQLWSTPNGEIKVQSISHQKSKTFLFQENPIYLKRLKEEINNQKNTLYLVFLKNNVFTIEKISFNKEIIKETYKLKKEEEISKYVDQSYIIPPVKLSSRMELVSEWELGFNVRAANPKTFYKDEFTEMVNLDTNYVGLICKRKDKRPLRLILKNESGEYIHKKYDKNADFILSKAECILNSKDEIVKIYLYDIGKTVSYRWEIGLDGIFITSKKI